MEHYTITANSSSGVAFANASGQKIPFDGTAHRNENSPSPAELLLCSLSACILKNVERFSELLKYTYKEAFVEITETRNDSPPFISEINYILTINTEMEENTLQLLHKNILKYGTITNTLSKATKLNGEIRKL